MKKTKVDLLIMVIFLLFVVFVIGHKLGAKKGNTIVIVDGVEYNIPYGTKRVFTLIPQRMK